MILIISEEKDGSTSKVIEWLLHYNADFVRINEEDIVEIIEISMDGFILKKDTEIIRSDDIHAIWYRRGRINYADKGHAFNDDQIKGFVETTRQQNRLEYGYAIDYIYYLLNKVKNRIGSRFTLTVNKMIVLDKAQSVGLLIPRSIIATEKDSVQSHFQEQNTITKPINAPLSYFEEVSVSTYTEQITPTEIPSKFGLSLLQECIEKQYEIRIFYLRHHFYAMAIFSQSDEQTKTDFRVYNFKNPNRYVPYVLPDEIESKLQKLMNVLHLDTGSIDLIRAKDGSYIFLEVNPVGQFGMLSHPCNQHLEELVAKELMKEYA